MNISQHISPIIIREMRSRMRGRRVYIVLTLHLLGLSLLVGGVYLTFYFETANNYRHPYDAGISLIQYGATIGKTIFAATTLMLIALFSLIAPAFGAGAIAGEKERQTFETLLITSMRSRQIISGKLGAIFTLLLVFLVASWPIQSLSMAFGGIAMAEIVITNLGLLVTALAFAAMGLFISSLIRTTSNAVMITYTIILPFIYGLPLLVAYLGETFYRRSWFENWVDLLAYPLKLLYFYTIYLFFSLNPFTSTALTWKSILADNKGYFIFQNSSDDMIGPFDGGQNIPDLWFISPWLLYVIIYSLLTLLIIFLTTRRISKASKL